MLRTKSRISSRSYNANSLKRSAKRVMDDSSSASDEVVFKGIMNRRQPKSEPAQTVPSTQAAAPPGQFSDSSQRAQHAQPVSINTIVTKVPTAPAPESEQPMEWKYRGRSGSETTNEPLPAPIGLDAQHHEGFQRFYKAVVSPTHVRVTAGGRIVPNTRNPVSPTAKRPKEEESVVNGDQSDPVPTSAYKQPMPIVGMPHPMPFFYPGFPGMPPMHPMTGMPMPMIPPGFPFPMPVPTVSTKENQAKKAEDKNTNAVPESEPAKSSIKISPPEQFDHTKPFMYNGQQWMFPMFPTPYPGFVGMPPPGYGGPHVPGAPMMIPPQIALGQIMGPMGMQPPQAPPAPVSSRQSTPHPPSKPPISSIRPSQITRKQIDGLRANLKYHEDQLQFNRHQIDEKDMENKIQLLQTDIERFERVFRAQVEYEGKHYPKADNLKEESSSSGGRSSAPSTKTSQSQSEESKESKATTVTTNSQPKPRKKDRSRDSVGLNSNKSSTASYMFDDITRDRLLGTANPGKKSSLPSDAALAPIFQPRSVSAFTVPITNDQGQGWQSAAADEAITQEQLDAAEKKLLAAGAKAWNLARQVKEMPKSPSQGSLHHDNSNLGVPYLVGRLPPGVNPYSTHRIEYEYNRKLTDEEIQARHLYWGKGPRTIIQGLPKYDGKNFYPPSPAKNVTPNESPSVRRGRVTIGITKTDYGFHGTHAQDIDPFCAATPNEAFLEAQETNNSNSPSAKSSQSFSSQAENHSEEFEKALAETKSIVEETEGSHSKDVSETKSADYHDPRANGTR